MCHFSVKIYNVKSMRIQVDPDPKHGWLTVPKLAAVRSEYGDLTGRYSLLEQITAQPYTHPSLKPVTPENVGTYFFYLYFVLQECRNASGISIITLSFF